MRWIMLRKARGAWEVFEAQKSGGKIIGGSIGKKLLAWALLEDKY